MIRVFQGCVLIVSVQMATSKWTGGEKEFPPPHPPPRISPTASEGERTRISRGKESGEGKEPRLSRSVPQKEIVMQRPTTHTRTNTALTRLTFLVVSICIQRVNRGSLKRVRLLARETEYARYCGVWKEFGKKMGGGGGGAKFGGTKGG